MTAQNYKRNRPTIGVLAGWSTLEGTRPDHYRAPVIQGIQSAARARQCNMLLSWGIRRITKVDDIYPAWPVVSQHSDFVPVGPWNTDGLIVFTPLGDDERSRYLQQLISEGFPILFIATGEQGPTIAVNNVWGVRQAIAHLAEHGHRRIAFVAGLPNDMGDSAIRLDAYRSAVAESNLDADPALVAWGWHDFGAGHRAVQELLQSNVKFTALLASNDNSAIGAMQAIKEAGLRIPRDIAVIGFDDQPIATAQVPPLSSVRVSLGKVGEQALVAMFDHIVNQRPLESIQIPPRVVKRQSCGCMPEAISSAVVGIDEVVFRIFSKDGTLAASVSPPQGQKSTNTEKIQQVVGEMLNVLPAELRFPGGDEIHHTCTTLVETFCKSLDEANPVYFQEAVMDCIQELERVDGNLDPWQEMISVLRREMILLPLKWKREHDEIRHFAENLLHQARVVVGESAQRQDQRHQYQRSVKALALNGLTAALSAAMNGEDVIEILNSHLAGTGIKHVRVQLFEAEGNDAVAWSVLIDSNSGSAYQRFASREFPPPGYYPPEEALSLILLPLVFQGEALGYVAFDASDLGACAVIAIQLAATIKVSQLHAQVVELSLTDPLTGLHNRRYFELFLKNEVSRSQRFSRSLAMIFVDVDNFKEYNDSFGHPAGDEALQQVAKCLANARRSADIVARIGGDEFVVILPETDSKGALAVGRRIRTAIMDLSDLKRPISASIGLTAALGLGMSSEALIKQADTALYESKRRGRNRITIVDGPNVLDEQEYPSIA